MTDFEYENGIANNSSANYKQDAFANPTATTIESEENHDTEITRLFDSARDKLEMVDANARKQKRQIVVDLAQKLEGKIAIDTISMEIVLQLRGKVSERFIHECLDKKYKQEHRVENAKKQQKQRPQKELQLAAVTPLNPEMQEEEEENNKQVIILEANGRTAFRKNEGEPLTTTTTDLDTTTTDMTFVKPPHQLQPQQDQEQKSKKPIDQNHEPAECHSCQVLYDENLELKEALEKSSQLITADKMVTMSPMSTYNDHADASNDILPFEFSMLYKDLQRHMQELFQKTGINGKVWFSGKINTKTGVVTSSDVGRINQPQHQQ